MVIEGTGDRAFCAGGDIIALREAQVIAATAPAADAFFTEEYALNLLIATYPKPYIALIDGICMGGGIGMSVHGPYRVATEHAGFGMPETAIGFFPDIGATFLLPRLRGHLGAYLGLTGLRLSGADAVHAGLATHFVPRATLPALSAALAKDGPSVLAEFAQTLPPFSLAEHLDADRTLLHCRDRAGDHRLPGEGSCRRGGLGQGGAEGAAARFRPRRCSGRCRHCATVRDLNLPEALDAEFRLTKTTMAHPDFTEGVRAMVVDKDRKPEWFPAVIEDVDPAAIDALFAELTTRFHAYSVNSFVCNGEAACLPSSARPAAASTRIPRRRPPAA